MSRDLVTLKAWAEDKAQTDDDPAARPLWAQIAAEVTAYLDDEPATGPADIPFDFGDQP